MRAWRDIISKAVSNFFVSKTAQFYMISSRAHIQIFIEGHLYSETAQYHSDLLNSYSILQYTLRNVYTLRIILRASQESRKLILFICELIIGIYLSLLLTGNRYFFRLFGLIRSAIQVLINLIITFIFTISKFQRFEVRAGVSRRVFERENSIQISRQGANYVNSDRASRLYCGTLNLTDH